MPVTETFDPRDPATDTVLPQPDVVPPADPELVEWLTPPTPPAGLQLVDERRELISDCGPLTDCGGTIPQATLRYDTDEPAMPRSVLVRMQIGVTEIAEGIGPAPEGELQPVGDRSVVIETTVSKRGPETLLVRARWDEPDGYIVDVQFMGVALDQVHEVIESMVSTSPDAWPNAPIEPTAGRCIDERTRLAPTFEKDGWNRFIIEAAPVDGCDIGVFLFMSFTLPSDVPGGGLVTIVTQPALGGSMVQQGEPITINGNVGTISGPTPLGDAQSHTINVVSDAVFIDVHGTAPVETLVRIAESIQLVDEATWAQIVSEIQVDPDEGL